jgi:predicted SAM-dependent methyltransferase
VIPAIKAVIKQHLPPLVLLARALKKRRRERRSRHVVERLLRSRENIFLEVGPGEGSGRKGWVTVDLTATCDIYWDLRKGLPFPDNSIHKIYSSHFMEHLSFQEGQLFMDECRRALVPAGTFSICVPNARIFMEAYVQDRTLDRNPYFDYPAAFNNTTKIDYVNYMAYMDGHHKYLFDEENLLYLLTAKGFREVRVRSFDPDLDLERHRSLSIYAEAVK